MGTTDKPWTSYYGPGVRTDIEAASYRNLADLISSASDTYGKAKAFTACLPNGMNGSLSFRQIDAMSDAFAVYLREVAGLSAGDRVAVQMPNCLSFPVAAFGIFKAGCVLVNVNPLYTTEEMAKQFEDAEPHALVIMDLFADKIPGATKGHPIPNVIVTRVAEFFPAAPRGIVGLVQRYWDRSIPDITVAHIRLPAALAAGRAIIKEGRVEAHAYHQSVALEDLAVLQYTGGTTGVAKGAMLTHGNLIFNMEQSMELLAGDMEKGKEVILTALPLYHIFAFTVSWLGAAPTRLIKTHASEEGFVRTPKHNLNCGTALHCTALHALDRSNGSGHTARGSIDADRSCVFFRRASRRRAGIRPRQGFDPGGRARRALGAGWALRRWGGARWGPRGTETENGAARAVPAPTAGRGFAEAAARARARCVCVRMLRSACVCCLCARACVTQTQHVCLCAARVRAGGGARGTAPISKRMRRRPRARPHQKKKKSGAGRRGAARARSAVG
ncbi:MAG: AMP-binding protein, partial [Pseudomonadota bacterium]